LTEITFQMQISDPPLAFDLKQIGEKVQFNSFKFESMDGFVKQNDDCYVILPPILKQNEVLIKSSILPLNYEFP